MEVHLYKTHELEYLKRQTLQPAPVAEIVETALGRSRGFRARATKTKTKI